MVPKLSAQKYNGARGKADLLKKIQEKLLKVEPRDVDPELVWTAYGLGQLTCGKHSGVSNPKATNCKENPYCLGRLGLEKFEKLIKKSEDLRNEKMVESVRRDSMKQPCGLVNWANFCYVNSFLQIWFNDPVFRQIIYDWRPSDAYVTPVPPAMDVQQVMNALQHLFFTLDTTPYEDANGEEFCKALRLNQEQQDAQEFTVMFFDSIDRNLMKHPNGETTRDRIQERFNGMQTSSLRCKCGHHSDNTTKFSALALSIDGHTTLTGAIKGYFADECLSDFSCSGCGQRGGVVRETSINHLPPVLLLSLNRYVYDSTTGRRKKLKTPLQYPRVLNVDGLPHREMLSEEESRYELSAVMVHEGDNADCGHYWDIIRHPFSGVWFKYNDKHVKETKAPGVETEKETAPSKPNIDLKYCYGLVYRRKEGPMKQPRHPAEDICGKWTKEMDHKFYRMTDADAQASEITLEEVSVRHRVVGDHMAALEVKPERAFLRRAKDLAFLPTALLSGILNTEYTRASEMKDALNHIADELDQTICEEDDKASASQSESDLTSPQKRKKNVRRRVKSMYDKRLEQVEIANSLSPTSLILCPHERISYESVLSGEVKAVNRAGAEKLCKDYGLRMNVVSEDGVARRDQLRTCLELCTECVQDKTRDVHFASRLEEDAALAVKVYKEVNTRCSVKAFFNRQPPPGSFYVAKSALTTFKRDAQRERSMKIVDPPRCTWTIGPADAARAAVGETEKEGKKRRKREQREAAGGGEEAGEEEEQPVMKCARSDAEDGVRTRRNGNGRRREEEEEGERDAITEEVEETIRGMMDELVGPSQSTISNSQTSVNGYAAAAAAAAVVAEEEEEEPRAESGRENGKRGRRRAMEEIKEEEEDDGGEESQDDQMKGEEATVEEEEDMLVDEGKADDKRDQRSREAKKEEEEEEEVVEPREAAGRDDGKSRRKVKKEVNEEDEKEVKKEKKRERREESNASDESDVPSSPALNGENGENGQEEGEESGRNSSNDDEDNQPIIFNEALRCDHDGLNVTEFRHMVTEREWARLSIYFDTCFEVSTAMPVCEECKNFDASATADKQASSAIVKGLNEAVGDILKAAEKRAATAAAVAATAAGGNAFGGCNFTRGVCSIFVEKARKVINPRSKARMLPPLCQACLVCDHGAPRYGTSPMGHRPFIVPLTRDEWEKLKKCWATATEAAGSADDDDGDAVAAFADLEIELCPISGAVLSQCTPCYESLLQEEEACKYVFDEEYVYVKMQADEQSTSKGGEKEDKEKEKKGDKGSKEGSEDSQQDVGPLEIVTTAPSSSSAAASAAPAAASNGGRVVGAVTVGGRSSTRRGASKGLIKVRMSSHQTVKDLKIALIKHTNYAPVDQLLYSTAGGDPLDDELTLMEAKVLPDNYDTPLILIVQSATDASLASPTNDKTRAVERGFYDTALAH